MNKLSIEELKAFESNPTNNFLTRGQMMDVVRELISIRELKGDQVPVAYQSVSTSSCNRMVTLHKEMAEDWGRKGFTIIPLFTAPQNPVVLRQIGSIDHDGGEYGEYFVEFTDSAEIGRAVYVIEEGEAAGIVVKDGD